MVKLREKLGRVAVLLVAMPVMAAGAVESLLRDFFVLPVDDRDVEIGELRAEIVSLRHDRSTEATERRILSKEVERLKTELVILEAYADKVDVTV